MNNNLFKQVRDLKLPAGKFVIFGSGPMGIRGLRKCEDIDIVVASDVFE